MVKKPHLSKRMDIINSLRDDILCHIVSFLSAKEACFRVPSLKDVAKSLYKRSSLMTELRIKGV